MYYCVDFLDDRGRKEESITVHADDIDRAVALISLSLGYPLESAVAYPEIDIDCPVIENGALPLDWVDAGPATSGSTGQTPSH